MDKPVLAAVLLQRQHKSGFGEVTASTGPGHDFENLVRVRALCKPERVHVRIYELHLGDVRVSSDRQQLLPIRNLDHVVPAPPTVSLLTIRVRDAVSSVAGPASYPAADSASLRTDTRSGATENQAHLPRCSLVSKPASVSSDR
jgi:hypothetical protein